MHIIFYFFYYYFHLFIYSFIYFIIHFIIYVIYLFHLFIWYYREQLRQRLVSRTVNHSYQINKMNFEQQNLKRKLFECSSLLRQSINFINYSNPDSQLPDYLVDIDFNQFKDTDE